MVLMVLMGLGSGYYLPFTKALGPTTVAAAYGEEWSKEDLYTLLFSPQNRLFRLLKRFLQGTGTVLGMQ